MMEELTIEKFKAITFGEVIATGFAKNQPDSLYMVSSNQGRELKWIAKKGGGNDWAIYTHWKGNSDEFIKQQGQKVHDKENIRKLVPCTDEVLKLYRN